MPEARDTREHQPAEAHRARQPPSKRSGGDVRGGQGGAEAGEWLRLAGALNNLPLGGTKDGRRRA